MITGVIDCKVTRCIFVLEAISGRNFMTRTAYFAYAHFKSYVEVYRKAQIVSVYFEVDSFLFFKNKKPLLVLNKLYKKKKRFKDLKYSFFFNFSLQKQNLFSS